jgi:low affinity Fe/Cu permease
MIFSYSENIMTIFWHNVSTLGYNHNMSSRQVIIILGILTGLLPFLGFSSNWDTVISVFTGILIIILAYRLSPVKKDHSAKDNKEKNLPFVENKNESEVNPNI